MKRLLILLRDHIKNKDRIASGLCLETRIMFNAGIITHEEYNDLQDYIYYHRPKRGKHFTNVGGGWHWNITEVPPRLAWLNDQIKNFHNNR